MAFAKYTIEVFCQLGDEDNPELDGWGQHHGKGQSAAGNLAAAISNRVDHAGTVRAIRREIVDEVPQWLTEVPEFADDPDPAAALIADLLASRAMLHGIGEPAADVDEVG